MAELLSGEYVHIKEHQRVLDQLERHRKADGNKFMLVEEIAALKTTLATERAAHAEALEMRDRRIKALKVKLTSAKPVADHG